MNPAKTVLQNFSYGNTEFIKNLKELTVSIDVGIVITDEKENILWVNKMFEEISGMTLDELKSKKPNILQGRGTDISVVRKIRSSLDDKESVNASILNYKPDNTPYWIRLSIAPIKNARGEIENFVGFEHDIPHEKKTETDLRETENQYKDLFEKNPCVMWICDVNNFRFVEVNQAAIDSYGYSREEFMKMSLSDVKPQEDHHMLKNTFLNASETYKDRGIMRHIKKNGEIIFVEVKTNRIKYEGKICSLALLNDITEKLKKEQEIEELNKQLSSRIKFIEEVSDNIPGALFRSVCYPDGKEKLIYSTEGFTEFWGISLKEGLADSSLRYGAIHPDDFEKATIAFKASVNNLTKLDNKYRYVNPKTGKVIWARIMAVPRKDENGNVILTGVVMNVNESEKYYHQLERANQRFEYVSKAANELIWDLDLTTNIISFGGSYKEMFGYVYPDDKTELSKIMHFIHPDDSERVAKGIADALKDGNKRYWEDYYKVLKKGGGIVYVHDRAYIIHDECSGKPVRFVGVIQNITQRKKDEEAILEQMRKVNIIIDSISDVFYVVDKNYNLLFANETMEKLSGYVNVELIGKNIWAIFKDADLSLPKDLFKKAFEDNLPCEFEMDYKGITFEVHVHPSEIGLVVSGKDISLRKEHEEEIKRNEKFIKEISDSTAGFMFQIEFDTRLHGKLNYASEKAFDYWGTSIKEVMEEKIEFLTSVHPEDIQRVNDELMRAVTNLANVNIKYRYVNKIDDEVKWVRAEAVPTRLENGNTIVNGIMLDITEIENNNKQLIDANRRYEYLSRATHETIWEADLELHEMKLGGGYKEMYGKEFYENKMTYEDWKKFVHPDDLAETIKCMQDALDDPEKRYCECSYRIIRVDGKEIDVFEKAYIIYDEKSNTPVKIIGSTQDVTELSKIQKEKNDLISDLVKRNKALEQFTFMVSHNLRAPIANMMGIHDILEDKNLDKESRGEMDSLNKKSVFRLNEVIADMNEILNVKKNIDEDRTEVIFDTVLSEIKDVVFSIIKNTKIVMTSDFEKARSVFSIKSYIYSIFQNLITNSIKYRQDGSSFIKITSDEDAEFTYLTFEDDGLGIDLAKNQNKIFGLYNKFHNRKDGKGMGLFMVKSQIDSLDGEINVESEVNKGTKFFIKLRK